MAVILDINTYLPILNKRLGKLGFTTKEQREIEDTLKEQFGEDEVESFLSFGYYAKERLSIKISQEGCCSPSFLYFGKFLSLCQREFIIHKPEVTVTNENGQHTIIYDLFIRVCQSLPIYSYPTIQYLRSTYTKAQWNVGYLHSHSPSIYNRNIECIRSWHDVCLGSGNINTTLRKLGSTGFNYYDWKVFAMQLDQITRVESLAGGPYIRLETINEGAVKIETLSPFKILLGDRKYFRQFLLSYIKSGRFKVVYGGHSYVCGECFTDWLINFTEYYIKWKELAATQPDYSFILPISYNYCIRHKELYRIEPRTNYQALEGTVITFRGKDYPFKLIESEQENFVGQSLIVPEVGLNILNALLEIINFRLNTSYEPETRETKGKRKPYAILQDATVFVG